MSGTNKEAGTVADTISSFKETVQSIHLADLKRRALTVGVSINNFLALPSLEKAEQVLDNLKRLEGFCWITKAKWEEFLKDTKNLGEQTALDK